MVAQPDDYALVVGIEHYPYYESLPGAARDAEWFRTWLVDEPAGGGLAADHCEFVDSTEDPVRPIHDDIDEALERLVDRAAARRNETGHAARRFYFYFAGHGLASEERGADLCLAKWSSSRRNLALTSFDYITYLANTGVFREVAAFLDCCRVFQMAAAGLHPTLWQGAPAAGAVTRRFTAYAAEFNDVSWETGAGTGGGLLPSGYFTRALRLALSGEAARPGGGVTAADLKDYLEEMTPILARRDGVQQTPEVENGLAHDAEGNPPVFGSVIRPPEATRVTIEFDRPPGNTIRLEDPSGVLVREGLAGTGPWEVTLESVVHVLEDVTAGVERVLRVPAIDEEHHVRF